MEEIVKKIASALVKTGKIPFVLLALLIIMLSIFGYFSVRKGIDTIFENLPKILEQLVKSPLGIFALMIIALSLIGFYFFQQASEQTRVSIFVLMFVGVVAFGVSIVRSISKLPTESLIIITPTPQPTILATVTPTPTPIPTPIPTAIPTPAYDIAVLIVDEQGTINWTLSHQLVELLRTHDTSVATSFPEKFVSEGSFEKVFQGDTVEINRVGVLQYSRYAILGKISISFTEQTDHLANMITADMVLELHTIASEQGIMKNSRKFQATGIGGDKEHAKNLAVERVLESVKTQLPTLLP